MCRLQIREWTRAACCTNERQADGTPAGGRGAPPVEMPLALSQIPWWEGWDGLFQIYYFIPVCSKDKNLSFVFRLKGKNFYRVTSDIRIYIWNIKRSIILRVCLDPKKFLVKNITSNDMHGVLNVDEKKIAQFARKLRDESFKPNWAMIWQYDATVNIY